MHESGRSGEMANDPVEGCADVQGQFSNSKDDLVHQDGICYISQPIPV